MHFEEVMTIYHIDPGHPNYKKPDIGDCCIKKSKQLISFENISSCYENPENINWTNILIGHFVLVIEMSYEETKNKIIEAHKIK